MDATRTPTTIHPEFERMCEALEEFEPLPTPTPAAIERRRDEEDDESPLDEQILAGLVSPL